MVNGYHDMDLRIPVLILYADNIIDSLNFYIKYLIFYLIEYASYKI